MEGPGVESARKVGCRASRERGFTCARRNNAPRAGALSWGLCRSPRLPGCLPIYLKRFFGSRSASDRLLLDRPPFGEPPQKRRASRRCPASCIVSSCLPCELPADLQPASCCALRTSLPTLRCARNLAAAHPPCSHTARGHVPVRPGSAGAGARCWQGDPPPPPRGAAARSAPPSVPPCRPASPQQQQPWPPPTTRTWCWAAAMRPATLRASGWPAAAPPASWPSSARRRLCPTSAPPSPRPTCSPRAPPACRDSTPAWAAAASARWASVG